MGKTRSRIESLQMFDTVLIANRGEIACRIIVSAKRLGLRTVAVYSDADANAAHVAMADQAVRIGPPSVAESYLRADKIIEAAKATGAQAIHPGYGFLSENPDFVDAVTDAGLTFVGPPASAIRAMGLKDAAKALMEQAGVPVVPGYHGAEQEPDFLAQQAEHIGYPVLIKARAGGGGKGMRKVDDPADFAAELAAAQREAQAAFGDPSCLIEKYVLSPRHIEIQVMADAHGNCVHLFERDCSLQRRHQKVIEEAPAPGMTIEMRNRMGAAAVEAAKSIGYVGAGTVEFIVDGSEGLLPDRFWFMEMNTRLQVEHPVSEAITGLDFVAMQLNIARGDVLPVTQDNLHVDGHAFEARIYAEDVDAGFLPATGTLKHLRFPDGISFDRASVRTDSGVRQGDEISPHYDPMIAKLITHGPDRSTALLKMHQALADCRIAGTTTNLAFLSALANHDGFKNGVVDTGLIARDLATLLSAEEPRTEHLAIAALASSGLLEKNVSADPRDALRGFTAWGRMTQTTTLIRGGEPASVLISCGRENAFDITVGAETVQMQITNIADDMVHYTVNGATGRCFVAALDGEVTVFFDGLAFRWECPDLLAGGQDAQDTGDTIVAPMPGLVKIVHVAKGQAVKMGEPILVLEAMKMEHALNAPRDGKLEDILITEGTQVNGGAVLVTLEPTS